MRLIFDDEIYFLKEKLNIEITSEQAFMDRMGVKMMDFEGNWHTIFRIRAKDMKLTLVKDNSDKLKDIEFMHWEDIIEKNKDRLLKLESDSLEIIRTEMDKFKGFNYTVPVSGGKDSAIVHTLVNAITSEFNTVFSNTSNETHHTYKYINRYYPNAKTVSPSEGFYPFVERTGFVPTRFGRACCTVQKEMPMIEQLDKDEKIVFFMGMRKAESQSRSEYSTYWKNHRWGKREWQGVLPILEWGDLDVLLYMLFREIPFNPLYTMGFGRVGCTNCCFRSDYELILNENFLKMYHDRWQLILEKDFVKNKKASILNCDIEEYKNGAWKAGTVRDEATEEIIIEFAEQQGLDLDVARRYFDKRCSCCDKKLKALDIALSMKFYGRKIESFKCIKDISKDLSVPVKELKLRAKEFKEGGCDLF